MLSIHQHQAHQHLKLTDSVFQVHYLQSAQMDGGTVSSQVLIDLIAAIISTRCTPPPKPIRTLNTSHSQFLRVHAEAARKLCLKEIRAL